MNMNIQECKGCRKRKEIVKHYKSMQYCAGCAHKIPSYAKAYESYVHEHSRQSRVNYDLINNRTAYQHKKLEESKK